jgi:dienelactone hydrolase
MDPVVHRRERGVVSDHPVVLNTSVGPIGGMVSEPEGERRAAAVVLSGVNGRRFGVNQVWTHIGWDLAAQGYVTFRADYPGGSGDSSLSATKKDIATFEEITSWFRDQVGQELDLLAIGSCFGARLAVGLGARVDRVLGVGLIVPAFSARRGGELFTEKVKRRMNKTLGRNSTIPVDPRLAEAVAGALAKTKVWTLVGERDHRSRSEMAALVAELDRRRVPGLQIDEVPGLLLHGQPSLDAQRVTRERVVEWAAQQLNQEVVRS